MTCYDFDNFDRTRLPSVRDFKCANTHWYPSLYLPSTFHCIYLRYIILCIDGIERNLLCDASPGNDAGCHAKEWSQCRPKVVAWIMRCLGVEKPSQWTLDWLLRASKDSPNPVFLRRLLWTAPLVIGTYGGKITGLKD